MKKATKPKRSAAWLRQHRHAMFLAGVHWDHYRATDRPAQSRFQDYARDLVMGAAAEAGVQVQSRTELSARQYGAAVTAIRSKMVKDGVYIPAKGKVTDPEGVKASVVLEMLARLRSELQWADWQVDAWIKRQLRSAVFDADNPAHVGKLHGGLKALLSPKRKEVAA